MMHATYRVNPAPRVFDTYHRPVLIAKNTMAWSLGNELQVRKGSAETPYGNTKPSSGEISGLTRNGRKSASSRPTTTPRTAPTIVATTIFRFLRLAFPG